MGLCDTWTVLNDNVQLSNTSQVRLSLNLPQCLLGNYSADDIRQALDGFGVIASVVSVTPYVLGAGFYVTAFPVDGATVGDVRSTVSTALAGIFASGTGCFGSGPSIEKLEILPAQNQQSCLPSSANFKFGSAAVIVVALVVGLIVVKQIV